MTNLATTTCEQKKWGTTRRVFERNGISIAHASIVKGGYSSKHYHRFKNNAFQVVSGLLHVQMFVDGPLNKPVTYVLTPDMIYHVPAGAWHRFVASEKTELIEIYDNVNDGMPSADDIVRHDEGGVDLDCSPP